MRRAERRWEGALVKRRGTLVLDEAPQTWKRPYLSAHKGGVHTAWQERVRGVFRENLNSLSVLEKICTQRQLNSRLVSQELSSGKRQVCVSVRRCPQHVHKSRHHVRIIHPPALEMLRSKRTSRSYLQLHIRAAGPRNLLRRGRNQKSHLWRQSRLNMLVTLGFLLVILVNKIIYRTSTSSSVKSYRKMAPSESVRIKDTRWRVCVESFNIQTSRESLMNGYWE